MGTPGWRRRGLKLPERSLFVASAPGRVDFLNTHQDYKGLPVVPVAVNLRTYVAVVERSERFEVESINLREEGLAHRDSFPAGSPPLLEKGWWGNYLRAVVRAVEEHLGRPLRGGFRAVIHSEVPVGSGLSSSAALEVAFAKALDHFFNLGLRPEELAELAFQAENRIAGIPCGRLDQYASALGGAILLHPRPPARVEPLPVRGLSFAVVDSGIRHSVADIHPRRQEEINRGLRALMSSGEVPGELKARLGYRFDEPAWEELRPSDLEPYLGLVDEVSRRRILFTLLMHESTLRAVEALRRGDVAGLAAEVNRQHELLRDLYEVSTPELERIRDSMLEAGALAVKISGAGMGGSLLALAPGREERVLEAGLGAGAARGWVLSVDEGARIEG
ncbi:MAG: hypothetical protein LM563_03585 [Thermofilum sp.]|nr:hypothetical protein [Thermofilum sp.]